MKAGVEEPRVTVSSSPGQLDVELRFRNDGPDEWSPSGGYSAGYQVFDAETGILILDGERTDFSGVVAPGDTAAFSTRVELGETPGRFLIFVSPLVEGVAWFFDRGSSFLLIDAAVTELGTMVHRSEVTSMRAVRLRRAMRSAVRAFTYPFATLFRHGPLIRSLVRRDIAGRYRGSYGGMFWTLIHPLLMMLTYYFVFGLVLQTRFGSDARPSNFVMYFLAGMLPWLAFSEAVGRAPTTVIEHGSFVKKLLFPVEALPVTLVLAGLVSEAFGVAIFVTGMLFFGYTPTAAVLYLPLLLIPQFLLTLGLSWLLGRAGSVLSRPGPVHRIPADGLVFYDPDLLSGDLSAAELSLVIRIESALRAGQVLSRYLSRSLGPALDRAWLPDRWSRFPVYCRPRLVL